MRNLEVHEFVRHPENLVDLVGRLVHQRMPEDGDDDAPIPVETPHHGHHLLHQTRLFRPISQVGIHFRVTHVFPLLALDIESGGSAGNDPRGRKIVRLVLENRTGFHSLHANRIAYLRHPKPGGSRLGKTPPRDGNSNKSLPCPRSRIRSQPPLRTMAFFRPGLGS